MGATCKDVFAAVYANHEWGVHDGTRSGGASTRKATDEIARLLPTLVRELGCSRLLDLPCGEWGWMQRVDRSGLEYVGVDVVPGVIDANRERYPGVRFECLDATREGLPPCEVILCKDLMEHLSQSSIEALLARIRGSGARYLITSRLVAFPRLYRNRDGVEDGGFWPVRLAPAYLQREQHLVDLLLDRHVYSIWRLSLERLYAERSFLRATAAYHARARPFTFLARILVPEAVSLLLQVASPGAYAFLRTRRRLYDVYRTRIHVPAPYRGTIPAPRAPSGRGAAVEGRH